MRPLPVALALAATLALCLALPQSGEEEELEPLEPEDFPNRSRHTCTTTDGLSGVCRPSNRCPPNRRRLTQGETACPGGRRRRKICCPFRRQGGNRDGTSGRRPVGGSRPGGTNGGSSRPGGSTGGGVGQGECGVPTPIQVWLRRKREAPQTVTPGPFIPFIVGGKNAEIGKWPWIALIGNKQSGRDPFWFCGGSLIDQQHILTAAHCLKPRAVDVTKLVVRLGEYDTSRTDDGANPQDYGVASFTNHKNFKFPVLHDDISVVKLERPVQFNDFIKPICLPSGPSGDYAGTRIDVAGWGYTEFGGETSEVLQEVSLPVVAILECQSKYEPSPTFQNQFPGGFGDTKLCAAEKEGGKDACQGDSGGPMVQKTADERYELIGVVSAGVGCGTPGFPGVYTRVSAYLDWIRQNTA